MTKQEKNLEKERKYFIIDTSVILDNVENLILLSEGNNNYLFLDNTIIEEVNRNKENKNFNTAFQAKAFGRATNNDDGANINFDNLPQRIKSAIKNNKNTDGDKYYRLALTFPNILEPIFVIVIYRETYRTPLVRGVKDDPHIAEIATDYSLEIITNDVLFKTISRISGLKANSYEGDKVDNVQSITYLHTCNETDCEKQINEATDWSQFIINEEEERDGKIFETGRKKFGIKKGTGLTFYDFENNDYLDDIYQNITVRPINLEQKFYFQMLTDPNNQITVCEGSTGSGKTLIALQAGLHLLQKREIDGIVYSRNTVTATDSQSEMGFRKGDERQKLSYFMQPLYSAINFTISKHKKDIMSIDGESSMNQNEETISFMEDNNIETIDIAHLRGVTIENKLIIIDECQNMDLATLKLIGTRVGKRSRILYLGDVNQVDHAYLTSNRNSLAKLLEMGTKHNQVAGIKLTKTVRSEIAEFFDKNL